MLGIKLNENIFRKQIIQSFEVCMSLWVKDGQGQKSDIRMITATNINDMYAMNSSPLDQDRGRLADINIIRPIKIAYREI